MLFSVDIPTPANTPKAYPVNTKLRVGPGTTGQVWVGFPPGPKGLAHLQVWHWGSLLWPCHTPVISLLMNAPGAVGIPTAQMIDEASFHWDDVLVTFEDPYQLTAEPYDLVIRTWNEDDSYPHTLFFGLIVKPAPGIETALSLDQVLADLGITNGEV